MKKAIFLIPLALSAMTFAELITDEDPTSSLESRITNLEKSVSNLNEIAIISKLEAMQNQIITLNRQIDFLQAGQNTVDRTEQPTTSILPAEKKISLTDVYQAISKQNWDQALSILAKLDQSTDKKDEAEINFWKAEIYLEKGDSEKAKSTFVSLVNNYPQHSRAPDALFKLSKIARKNGNQLMANRYIETLKVQYPNSTALQYIQSQQKPE